ncbi:MULTISPECIES: NAD-dependent epimerase/dehydratase family protein [unclassified Guyparkeria]|uniref:NAD-dependent epimerase/dehydratase family protein n=1 Tax=unclassified Guyparkeria TaxID=2626246 RepID=UPI0007338761|nr:MULTISPECIES: NAD-dependent epimerase/dehydratase family protein [unclassified Guyparkeria]KTG17124.1 hypothetical protein AUR63_10270 [Guyparkeria sp. XI15]OAE86659.1 hypothetical protein AWR35_10285 [Guyparkeria sp. WRN-7]
MADHIVVLGANGFVGQRLVRQLLEYGKRVTALTRHEAPDIPHEARVLTGDFEHPDDFANVLADTTAVVHAASCSTPLQTAGRPRAELTNLRPSLALLEGLQRVPECRLIYLSSGGTLYGETSGTPAAETAPLRPRSYYGAGKAAIEQFIQATSIQFNLDAVILRPSNLYGPGQRPKQGFGIIPTAFDHVDRKAALPLRGGGMSVRDYLYIDDFIQLIRAALDAPVSPGVSTFNAASENAVSLDHLLGIIRDVTGSPLPVRRDTGQTVDVSKVELDASRARQQFNWQADTRLVDGLSATWEWWQRQP